MMAKAPTAGLPVLWVVVVYFLQDGERHVFDVVAWEVEVGSRSLVQPPVPLVIVIREL